MRGLNLGSEKPDLGFKTHDMGFETPHLASFEALAGGDRKTDRRKTETGENCPMWNHRSSAPPGPLPKKDYHTFEQEG